MTNASEKIVFHVSTRDKVGTSNVSKIRKEGRVPGNIYGLKEDSRAIVVDYQGLRKLYDDQGDTGLIYLQVDENKKHVPVLISEMEISRLGNKIIHVSFKRVSLNVKIEAEVSVELIGETKIDQAIVSLIKDTVLVEAFPADLPEKFEIDVSVLTEVGQTITAADLEYDKSKVELILGEDEEAADVLMVNVQAVKEEVEVEEAPEVEGEDGAVEGEGAEDGEDGAGEGESKDDSSKNEASE
jgi:large subunit ribosomal protein L25